MCPCNHIFISKTGLEVKKLFKFNKSLVFGTWDATIGTPEGKIQNNDN